MSSPILLSEAKLDAATYLYHQLRGWVFHETILDGMREHEPSNLELDIVDAKVLVLNTLYRTRLFATRQMAQHIVSVFKASSHSDGRLVEAISMVRFRGKSYRFMSFASKYCHFFVSPERYCIFDRYNLRALKAHLGVQRYTIRNLSTDYQTFLDGLRLLVTRNALKCSWRELDHYLYLWGVWRDYLIPSRRGRVAGAIKELFDGQQNIRVRQSLMAISDEC